MLVLTLTTYPSWSRSCCCPTTDFATTGNMYFIRGGGELGSMDVRGYRAKGLVRVGRGRMCPEGVSPWEKWRPWTILQLYPGFNFKKEENCGKPKSVSPKSVRNTSLCRLGLLFRGNIQWPPASKCYLFQTSLFSPRSGQTL